MSDLDSALEGFLNQLKLKQAGHKHLLLARHFLRHLVSALKQAAAGPAQYRRIADETLRNFPEDEAFIVLIREFHAFWTGPPALDPLLIPQSNPHALASLQATMAEDPLQQTSTLLLEQVLHQRHCLARYRAALVDLGLSAEHAQQRVNLISMLLYQMRQGDNGPEHYRLGVDALLAQLPGQTHWSTVISLAREFYYFLTQDPDAARKLQLNISHQALHELMPLHSLAQTKRQQSLDCRE